MSTLVRVFSDVCFLVGAFFLVLAAMAAYSVVAQRPVAFGQAQWFHALIIGFDACAIVLVGFLARKLVAHD